MTVKVFACCLLLIAYSNKQPEILKKLLEPWQPSSIHDNQCRRALGTNMNGIYELFMK